MSTKMTRFYLFVIALLLFISYQKKTKKVKELKDLMTPYIKNGRSTPSANQCTNTFEWEGMASNSGYFIRIKTK